MYTLVTKSYCPYCNAALEFLDSKGVQYNNIVVDNNQEIYDEYKELTGHHTVPQIFSGKPSQETFIGGYDDMIEKVESGELKI